MKYVDEYASAKGFIPLHHVKGFFDPELLKKNFPHDIQYHFHLDQDLLIQGHLLLISNLEEDILNVYLNLLATPRTLPAAFRHIIHLIQLKEVSLSAKQ